MILERLMSSLVEFFGIGCTGTLPADLAAMVMTNYIIWFEDPLIDILYRLGWSDRKPIALIELEDMFDLEGLR